MVFRSLLFILPVCWCCLVMGQDAAQDAKPPLRAGNEAAEESLSEQALDKKTEGQAGTDRSEAVNRRLVQQWLRQMDRDKDERIAVKESRGLMQKNFASVDANSNGFLEVKELNALSSRLRRSRGNRKPGGRGAKVVSDEQVKEMVGDQLVCQLNLPYREGNERWKLDLVMPSLETQSLRPAIVFIHGGGWVSGDKRGELFLGQAIEFAKKGYVCVTVNYRLDAAKLPCVEDVKCAVRWLRAHAKDYQIDPQRIGAYGNSAGAHLVSMLGVSASNRELEGDGPYQDYSSQVQAVAGSATPTRPMARGKVDENARALAPITYVSKEAPPFLLFHEVSDRLVNIGHADDFIQALKDVGANDVTYRRKTDGSGHAVYQKNRKEFSDDMSRFFARTLRHRVGSASGNE